MKLLRFGQVGQEKPGLLDEEGNIRDLSGHIDEIDGNFLSGDQFAKVRNLDASSLPKVEDGTRIAEPVAGVGKFICVGLNYADHAQESGMDVPPEPVLFMKATSAISGPYDQVELPPESKKSDWEVELGVVIGKEAKYVSEADAMDYVAGFCLINDLSEREYQLEKAGQWVKGKSCDTFGPTGPYLVTPDEVGDFNNLNVWLELNGERVQDGSTETMVYKVPFLVHYISQFMSLQPGDIISTGTPPGVGLGMKPPKFLQEGDVMRLGIDNLGEQRQEVIRYSK
ncbi:fumarylacetoacetate hydrolase family protein [Gilvimarinus agarilyticus]|uniref:fumarylacetoacetate hydrolase family protein n=1 Tax=unclassified Gilvimarinus TaxID=2642066 RepID=UPI001C082AD9|nr:MULTISPECIES: fumarylacetoacetate hydrolase family protein [unclassified Gilvimarinus]MBU2885634.1 fumarylacetoacetate hydrolase family protein [Gilvimarinus agarilyticus]MDO6570496.1 fumarylacetoacetate hydrolase family protein [Gilvimarinus sp. 2_MG-2023]MDO6748598.1 fumarylacetoacetate hydrolase family protein [Gilvimarinus sp. 1_MG-2023]